MDNHRQTLGEFAMNNMGSHIRAWRQYAVCAASPACSWAAPDSASGFNLCKTDFRGRELRGCHAMPGFSETTCKLLYTVIHGFLSFLACASRTPPPLSCAFRRLPVEPPCPGVRRRTDLRGHILIRRSGGGLDYCLFKGTASLSGSILIGVRVSVFGDSSSS